MERNLRERKKSTAKQPLKVAKALAKKVELLNPIQLRMQQDPYFRTGYLYQMAGNFSAAASCYARSIEKSPSPEAHTHLGFVLSQMGELEAAIYQARCALALNPQFGNAWNDLGAYLLETHLYDEAISCLQKALKSTFCEDPILPRYNLARAFMCKGMLVAADKELQTILKQKADFKPAELLLNQLYRQLQ